MSPGYILKAFCYKPAKANHYFTHYAQSTLEIHNKKPVVKLKLFQKAKSCTKVWIQVMELSADTVKEHNQAYDLIGMSLN